MTTLFLVTREGVYDHGVAFIGTTRQLADEFARTHDPDRNPATGEPSEWGTTPYHKWRIDELPVDEPTKEWV